MKKFAVAMSLVFVALMAPGIATPVVAQEAARYVGELTGGCSNLRGRTIQVDVQGAKITGVVLRDGGDIRFSGEMNGSSFNVTAKSQTPASVRGTIEGETIRATFDRQECSFKAVLKKKA